MAEPLNSIHALTVLYDLSLTVGGEVELEPLLIRSVQRLMYHTGFPVGVAVGEAIPTTMPGWTTVKLEVAIGDYGLVKQQGKRLRLPDALIADTPQLAEAPELLASFGTRKPQRYYLRLPIPGFGAIFLLGPAKPDTRLALQELFVPILSRLGNAIALCRRVHERTAQLEKANRELESFSYSVSHDLRAPLRAIAGFARLLRDGERDRLSDEGRNMFDRIGRNVAKLDALIEDILNYSRAARWEPEKDDVDMTTLVGGLAAELRDSYPHTAIRIAALPPARGDAKMLHQVFQNLLENACKYSSKREQPTVVVAAHDADGTVVYSVTDNGAGFDMHYADKLFGVFQRMHSESDFPGTGVGLAIVKRLIERQGGRIWAVSEPDRGAEFSFTLGN